MSVVVAAGLLACGPANADGTSSPSQPRAGAAALSIGYAVPVVANPYWQGNIAFARQMANELGVSLVVEDAHDQADTQLKNVEDLVARGVDAIVFGPVNTELGPAILKVCARAHIICTAAERKPGVEPNESNSNYFAGYVTGDDFGLGGRVAQLLEQSGARKCVAMSGKVGNSVADSRLSGFQSYASSHGIAVLSTFRPAEVASDGQQATENFLSQLPGPQFDCVFGFDGDVGEGAISALSKAGALAKVRVATIGPTSTNLSELESGQMSASIGGEFMDGGFAVIMAFDAVRGHRSTSGAVILHGVTVQQTNVARYATQFSGNPVTGYNAKALSATYNPAATSAGFTVRLN